MIHKSKTTILNQLILSLIDERKKLRIALVKLPELKHMNQRYELANIAIGDSDLAFRTAKKKYEDGIILLKEPPGFDTLLKEMK